MNNSNNQITKFRGEHFFLSNFYPIIVTYDGEEYNSVEHAYQAAKTFVLTERSKIQSCVSPAMAKKLGRMLGRNGYVRKDWSKVKLSIMEDLLKQKFSDGELSQKLLDTEDREIIEVNTWGGKFWGVYNGVGQNHLGKLLMKIREDMREKEV